MGEEMNFEEDKIYVYQYNQWWEFKKSDNTKKCPKCGSHESSGVIISIYFFENGEVQELCNSCAGKHQRNIRNTTGNK
jgi:hypothetical protein